MNSSTKKILTITFVLNILLTIVAIIFKAIQLTKFYDPVTSMVSLTGTSEFYGYIVFACIFLIIILSVGMGVLISVNSKKIPIENNKPTGIMMLISSLCFFIQSIVDIYKLLPQIQQHSHNINISIPTNPSITSMLTFAVISNIFCFLSAICFLIMSIKIIRGTKERYMLPFCIPVMWSTVLLISLMVSTPNTVSVEKSEYVILFVC